MYKRQVVNTAMEIGPTVGLALLVSLATAHTCLRAAGDAADAATTGGYGFALTTAAVVFAASSVPAFLALRPRPRQADPTSPTAAPKAGAAHQTSHL